MSAFSALVRKDLVLHFSNRRAVLMSIVAPILIAAFFGSLFGRKDSAPTQMPVALTDLDRSELTLRITAELRADPALALVETDADTALQQVRAGKLRAAITLPAGFGAQASRALFGAGPRPEIVLVYDPSQAMALPLVRGMLAQHVMQPVSQSALSGQGPLMGDMRDQVLANAAMPAARRDELLAMFDSISRVQKNAASAPPGASSGAVESPVGSASSNGGAVPAGAGLQMPFTTRDVEAAAADDAPSSYNSYAHSFAGMGVQFILLMGVDMGVGLLAMRRMGLWQRLRAAPLSRPVLLGSRIASCALIAFIVFAVIYAVAFAFFGVRVKGSVPGFVAVLAAFSLLTATFGLMIAALGRTPETTRGLAILATLLLVMLGGAWVPSFIFPPWLQSISAWMPTAWAIDGLDAMTWRGLPLSSALAPVASMLAGSALFAGIALARFDWEE